MTRERRRRGIRTSSKNWQYQIELVSHLCEANTTPFSFLASSIKCCMNEMCRLKISRLRSQRIGQKLRKFHRPPPLLLSLSFFSSTPSNFLILNLQQQWAGSLHRHQHQPIPHHLHQPIPPPPLQDRIDNPVGTLETCTLVVSINTTFLYRVKKKNQEFVKGKMESIERNVRQVG